MQFLHQCHLSKSLPLTYSTILVIPNTNYNTTDIFSVACQQTWLRLIGLTIFISQTFQELIFPVSFPDVIGALIPAVSVAFVNAVSALRIAEWSTLTHKAVSIITNAKLDFCLSILRSQTNSFSFHFKQPKLERSNLNHFF